MTTSSWPPVATGGSSKPSTAHGAANSPDSSTNSAQPAETASVTLTPKCSRSSTPARSSTRPPPSPPASGRLPTLLPLPLAGRGDTSRHEPSRPHQCTTVPADALVHEHEHEPDDDPAPDHSRPSRSRFPTSNTDLHLAETASFGNPA